MWEAVIGLEIHTQLNTKSKLFSSAPTIFGAEPNTQASIIDLAYPGTLPVINKQAIEKALLFGLAINAEIKEHNIFARKNYFYPDLPKGYQTSQMDDPIVGSGSINIILEDGSTKTIGITRAHLEEDAGKSVHDRFINATGIDLNRAGIPLLEIVSEPDMRSADEAIAYIKAIHSLVRYLDISDGNMSEGSFRCDCNISVRTKGQIEFGTRTELKNINSFKFVEKAIEGEISRQIELLEDGKKIIQETRLYDANTNETRSMRSKEEATDYRYFPCPDLLPVHISRLMLEQATNNMPELQAVKEERFRTQYNLNDYDIKILCTDKPLADFFEQATKVSKDVKITANWVIVELLALLNKMDLSIEKTPISAQRIGTLVLRIKDNTISGKIAKQLLQIMAHNSADVDSIIEQENLKQVVDIGAIETIVINVISNNQTQVQDYKNSTEPKKKKILNFLVGQVMKESNGKASPKAVNDLLCSKIDS